MILLFLLITFGVSAQDNFQMTYGTRYDDEIVNTLQFTDYSRISFMNKSHLNLSAISIFKTDSAGEVLWAKSTSLNNYKVHSAIKTSDGNAVFVGLVPLPNKLSWWDYTSIMAAKIDQEGNIIWNRMFRLGNIAEASDVIELTDSSILITGTADVNNVSNNFIFTLNLDRDGNLINSSSFSQGMSNRPNDLISCHDSTVLIVGGIESILQIVNIKPTGEIQWNKALYSNQYPIYNVANAIARDPENNYYITGAAGNGILCMKMNSDFEIEWSRIYKHVNGNFSEGTDIICLSDSLTVVTGIVQDSGFTSNLKISKNIILVGIDEHGDTLWTRSIGSKSDDRLYSIDSAYGSSFNISGTTYGLAAEKGYDGYLVSFDSSKENCNYRKCDIELRTITFSENNSITMGNVLVSADTTIEWIADTIIMHNACECFPPTAHFVWSGVDGELHIYNNSVWAEQWHWVIDDVFQSENQYAISSYGDNVNVCLTSENECGTDEYCEIVFGGVGLKEINEISLQISPVPSNDKVYLQFNNPYGNMDIRVIDAGGRLNLQYPDFNNNSLTLSKMDTGTGMFVVLFTRESRVVASKKFVFR